MRCIHAHKRRGIRTYIRCCIHAYIRCCIHVSADPRACGFLNSIRFDSKSEVKRTESEAKRKTKQSESEVKRSEREKRRDRAAKRLTKPACSAWADPGVCGVPGGLAQTVWSMENPTNPPCGPEQINVFQCPPRPHPRISPRTPQVPPRAPQDAPGNPPGTPKEPPGPPQGSQGTLEDPWSS